MVSDALIGVGGTLLGTILGYVLNECSKKGKNKISFENVDITCKDYNYANCTIGIFITLNIINSSSEIKNIIKPKIILKKDNKVLIEKNVKMFTDKSNYKDYFCCIPKVFTSIKLTKISQTIQFINPSQNQLTIKTKWFENCELFFCYTDDHGKIKKKRIYKDCLNENENFRNSLELKQKKVNILFQNKSIL